MVDIAKVNQRYASLDGIWREYAPAYSRVLPNVSFYADSLERMVSSIEGRQRILDIGLGPGILSEMMARRGHVVIGVDNDSTMLEHAKRRLTGIRYTHISGQNADSLAIRDNTIDGVVCNNVVYYVESPIKVFREAYRVLGDGGVFSVSGPTRTFDKRVLDEQMEKDLREKGIYDEMRREIEVIKRCNEILAARWIRNPFNNVEMEQILRDVGFSEIILSDVIYLGQCYFVSAVKGTLKETDLLRHDVVRRNVVIDGTVQIPSTFKPLIIGDYAFDVVRTPKEMIEIFGLRYRAYARDNLFQKEFHSPYDFDRYDMHAVIVYARNLRTGKIEATNRLILDSEMGLYLETSFDIGFFRDKSRKLAEGSRLAADPTGQRVYYKGKAIPITDIVLDRTTEFAKSMGITYILGLARVKKRELFTKNGFMPLAGDTRINLDDGKINPEEDLYPVVLDVDTVFKEKVEPLLSK